MILEKIEINKNTNMFWRIKVFHLLRQRSKLVLKKISKSIKTPVTKESARQNTNYFVFSSLIVGRVGGRWKGVSAYKNSIPLGIEVSKTR